MKSLPNILKLAFALTMATAASFGQTDSVTTSTTPSATLKMLDKQFKQLQSTNKNAQALEVLQRYGQLYSAQKQTQNQTEITQIDGQFKQNSINRQKQLGEIRTKSSGLANEIESLEASRASLHSKLILFFALLAGIITLLITVRNRKLKLLKAQLSALDSAKKSVSDVIEAAGSQHKEFQKSVKDASIIHSQLQSEFSTLKELSEDKNHPSYRQVRDLLLNMNQAQRISDPSFLSESTSEKEKVNLNYLLNDVSELAAGNFKKEVPEFEFEMIKDLEGILPETEVYKGDLRDTLFCLISNALRSVHQKAGNAPKGYKPKVTLSTRKLPRYIQIRIRDNGKGFGTGFNPETEEVASLVSNSETGLGILQAREVIKNKHKGELVFETEPGSQNDAIIRFQTLALQ